MSDWVYMVHDDSGNGTRFHNSPDVITWYEAHGWSVQDEPVDTPFVPSKESDPVSTPWVILVHPVLNVQHEFPNNPDAIQGAHETGWVFPDDLASEDTFESEESEPTDAVAANELAGKDNDNG